MNQLTRNYFHDLPPGPKPPEGIYAVIEIAAGSRNKYEYDRDLGIWRLDRVLYETVFYPTDYGFIPQTWSDEERDPLDIMVVSTHPTFPGCLIECRPIGIFKMLDNGRRDYKVIAAPIDDPRLAHIENPGDVNPHFKKEIENFWTSYCHLQPKKEITVKGWGNIAAAHQEIERAIGNYHKKFRSKPE
ncbi:inorganic diphosphatase [Candidatus Parcubacteria bacterium]|nr:inorganic diphosphatase [Candidatus Parcubacteria bacterium]